MSAAPKPDDPARPEGKGPHRWPTWPRVELGKHSKVTFSSPDRSRAVVGLDLLSELFAIGLLVDPAEQPPAVEGEAAALDVVLKGEGRFLVGQEDLGPRRGLRAISRGLVHVLEEMARGAESADQSVPPESTRTTPPTSDRGARYPVVTMTVEQAQESLDDLIDRVHDGTRIELTVPDGRRAVLLGWSFYAEQRERTALAEAAYWAAWQSGVFDAVRYAADMHAAGLRPSGGIHPDVDGPTAPSEAEWNERPG